MGPLPLTFSDVGVWPRCHDSLQEVRHCACGQCTLGQVQGFKIVKVDGKRVWGAGAGADLGQLSNDVPYLDIWGGGGGDGGEEKREVGGGGREESYENH